ncbi:MAG: peptidoglycan-binding protein [Clostridia bacterium]|nr:peptidoglycan-binding protein [Clostridia bacterium]
MDLLQTLLVYMSLVFATSVQTAPEPSAIPETPDYAAAYTQVTPTPTVPATPVPTIDITPNPAYKTLQVGDKGANVRAMQEKLQEYGYYTGEIDGAYGNQSRMAVERFQYMHGLTVDGIAGRRTLTVLFESREIRMPQGEPTPEPTIETQLAVALTPTPAPEGTPVPILTATPVPTATPKPTAQALPMLELQDYQLHVNGTQPQAKLFQQGDKIYVPLLLIMKEAGINVISSSSLELDEYAFAAGMNLVRFTHTENQYGEPVDLQLYCNDEPQLVPDRSLYRAEDILYVSVNSVESITGLLCSVDAEQKVVAVMEAAE